MSKMLIRLITFMVSFLPFVSALLYFSGDKYHDTRIRFWNHDPSMFPESVADKISLGVQVLTANIIESFDFFAIALLIIFILLFPLGWFLRWLDTRLNSVLQRFFKKQKSSEKEVIEGKGNSTVMEYQRTIMLLTTMSFGSLIVLAAFSFMVYWAWGASSDLAIAKQEEFVKRYDCSLIGEAECAKQNLLILRPTTLTLKNTNQLTGFEVDCSSMHCILYLGDKKIRRVQTADIASAVSVVR